MKLDRNANELPKYILINTRKLKTLPNTVEELIEALKENLNCIEFKAENTKDEVFCIKLKDIYSKPALLAYAQAAMEDDPEYASEIYSLSERAGISNLYCKKPD